MINTLTLNPAIDKILYVDRFTRNVTTRINRVVDSIGGKGTHVSLNLAVMGAKSRAFGIAHGPAGRTLMDMLAHEGVDTRFIHRPENNTRTNYLLAEATGDSTLITEKGVELTKDDIDGIVAKLREETQPGDFMALSGDVSNYHDPRVLNHIIQSLSGEGLKFFLDTSGQSLKMCVTASPFLIKPNLDELSTLVGRPVKGDIDDIIKAVDSLDGYGIGVAAVSLGGDGSLTKYKGGYYLARAPKVNVKNTVGCGDCFLAGLLYGFDTGMAFIDILKYATAVSAAAAECELSFGFDRTRADGLVKQINVDVIERGTHE